MKQTTSRSNRAFDPATRRVYCLGGGFMSVVQETDTGASLVAAIATPSEAHTLAIDSRDHSVWMCYFDTTGSYLQQWKPAN